MSMSVLINRFYEGYQDTRLQLNCTLFAELLFAIITTHCP